MIEIASLERSTWIEKRYLQFSFRVSKQKQYPVLEFGLKKPDPGISMMFVHTCNYQRALIRRIFFTPLMVDHISEQSKNHVCLPTHIDSPNNLILL